MDFLNYNSVESLPGYYARAVFTVNSYMVFKEDVDIVPTILTDKHSYIPCGVDNQMPFDILALVEKGETLATCQIFNAEILRQLLTDYHIFLSEWDEKRTIVISDGSIERQTFILSLREHIRWDMERLNRIIKTFDCKGLSFSTDDIIDEFRRYSQEYFPV